MSVARQTEIMEKSSSTQKTAFIATTYADDYTIQGKHFLYNTVETLNKSTTKTILIDFSAVETDYVVFQPIAVKSSAATITLNIYEGTNYTDGTPITLYNINRASTITPKTTFASAPTVPGTDPTKGTLFREHVTIASATGSNIRPDSSSGINITLIDTTKKYLLEFVNADTTNNTIIEINASFFEV